MLFGWKSTSASGVDGGALCAGATPPAAALGALASFAEGALASLAEGALADARAEAATVAAPVISDFNTLRRDGRSDM
jgi:hypothetical protein